ncbi:hypothetical protein [Pararhodobacter zhoushanensis]|uniref:Uncharacterized protein n=1 Tax=Pararhodobacter zhoushanensis TaxID=2479545 RepID=A0ABT3GYI2_9RHOB|nr:hypothetical protein [Pararhodobacter zhoushanensis]MCW1932603.1 hypothetical protein [Pararhodobacter zhoushanensis]
MAGLVIPGSTNVTLGTQFFLPEWYAQLYARLGGGSQFVNNYFAGWMLEPECVLLGGPVPHKMAYAGATGTPPAVTEVASMNDLPCFTGWNGSRHIDTGKPGGKAFTIFLLVNITQDMLDGGVVTNGRAITRFSGSTHIGIGVSETGALYFQLADSGGTISIAGSTLSAGPNLITATCHETSANNYLTKLFVNDLETPVGTLARALTMDLGSTWKVGSIGATTFWKSAIAGWMVLDRDITEDAAAHAIVASLAPSMVAWMTP